MGQCAEYPSSNSLSENDVQIPEGEANADPSPEEHGASGVRDIFRFKNESAYGGKNCHPYYPEYQKVTRAPTGKLG